MTTLQPMRAESFGDYMEAAIAGYAQDNIDAGRWPRVGALDRSRADFESLLPRGLSTPGNFIYEIVANEGGPVVGVVWIAIEDKHGAVSAYIYDIAIEPAFRRRGHALHALQALEPIAEAAGATGIGLNVFANNAGAQALYRKLGYAPTNFNMHKALGQGPR